jgi:hypothetical protein
MKGMVLIAAAVVVVVLAANLITVEVPSANPHEGAVAYTQPVVKSKVSQVIFSSSIASQDPTAPTDATATFAAPLHKYVEPAPVRKALWQFLIPAGTFLLQPAPGGDSTTGKCQVTTDSSLTTETYAQVVVLEPGGGATTWKSEIAKYTVSVKKVVSNGCNGITSTSWTLTSPEISYVIGTYYFQKGFGTYVFQVTIYRVGAPGASDTAIGSLSTAVTVSSDVPA